MKQEKWIVWNLRLQEEVLEWLREEGERVGLRPSQLARFLLKWCMRNRNKVLGDDMYTENKTSEASNIEKENVAVKSKGQVIWEV